MQRFLFQTHAGHCEYFATAMALFLRAEGIPSRLIDGYSLYNYNPVTGYYEVHRFDGHAWVEAYIAGSGWTTFEPTPAYPLPQQAPQESVALRSLNRYVKGMVAQQKSLGTHDWKAAVAVLISDLTDDWDELEYWAGKQLERISSWCQHNVILLAGAVMAAVAVFFVWWRLRSRFWFFQGILLLRLLASDEGLAKAALTALSRVGAPTGKGRRRFETVDEYLDRLTQMQPALSDSAARFAGLFNRSCYAASESRRLTPADRHSIQADFSVLARALVNG